MTYSTIDITCERCGSIINKMINLKPVKDILRPLKERCARCGISLNPIEFTIKVERR